MVVGGRELIDTLWNVNITTDNIVAEDGERINRYIMECKCIVYTYSRKINSELIDTLWNVNKTVMERLGHKDIELIDTLWNVNSIDNSGSSCR